MPGAACRELEALRQHGSSQDAIAWKIVMSMLEDGLVVVRSEAQQPLAEGIVGLAEQIGATLVK